MEDTEVWFHAKQPVVAERPERDTFTWMKPPSGTLKCNVRSSWSNDQQMSGAAWILRNHNGDALLHSRRSYSLAFSHTLADLHSLHWAVESMVNLKQTRIIFEFSLPSLRDALANPSSHPESQWLFDAVHVLPQKLDSWCLRVAPSSENKAALEIATSVTRDLRLHSYVARNGPS